MPTDPLHKLWMRYRVPLVISLIAVAIVSASESGFLLLRYDRTEIINGAAWRLLTAHLSHLGWPHLFMNLSGLWLIWILYGSCMTTSGWLWLLIINQMAISLALLVLNPELMWYVGLSGVLHGMFSCGIICRLRQGERSEWILMSLLVTKLIWEQLEGSLPGSASLAGGPVIVDAHLYGAIAGIFFALFMTLKRTTVDHEP